MNIITNVVSKPEFESELVESGSDLRLKLRTLDFRGLDIGTKRNLIKKELKSVYEDLPEKVFFSKMKTEQSKNYPDGYRLLVCCEWLKRQRYYDDGGIFPFGTLLKAINKAIDGKVNENLLAEVEDEITMEEVF